MTKRNQLTITALCILLIGATKHAAAAAEKAPAAGAKAPPNIVLIISDDHAWTDYSFMGHEHVRTPNIDRLAEQSLVFTRGYVPSSLCCPSLASIVTGLYPHQHKVTGNDPPLPEGTPRKGFYQTPAYSEGREVMNKHLEAVPTLPRLLAKAGYESLQTGKWWQGNYKRGGFTHGMTRGERHGDDGIEIGRKTMQPIYDFITEARDDRKPFFVWYAPMMPHLPHNPPDRLLEKYKALTPSLPVAKYWATVEWFDETVGQLMRYLDEQKLSDNTIVMYVADNGFIPNPKTGQANNRSKQSQYDGGLRTPIMIRWPGHVQPERSKELAMSLDITPTLLAATGLKPSPDMQGINLLDKRAVAERREIFGECFTHNLRDLNDPAASVRFRWMIDGDWKLIVPDSKNEPTSHVELYNLTKDPEERNDLASAEQGRVESMSKKLNAWWSAEPQQH